MGQVQTAPPQRSRFYHSLHRMGLNRKEAKTFRALPIEELILNRTNAGYKRFLVYNPKDFHRVAFGIEGGEQLTVGLVRCLEWDVDARKGSLVAHPNGPINVELDVLRKGYIGKVSKKQPTELNSFQPQVRQAGPFGLSGIYYIGFYARTQKGIGWVNIRALPEEREALEEILR